MCLTGFIINSSATISELSEVSAKGNDAIVLATPIIHEATPSGRNTNKSKIMCSPLLSLTLSCVSSEYTVYE